MGTIGRTRWLVGWSLHSHARSRSFLCASCNYRAANGDVDADMEERQLSRARGRIGYYVTYPATGLLLIAIFDHEKITGRNGIMWSKMRCERD